MCQTVNFNYVPFIYANYTLLKLFKNFYTGFCNGNIDRRFSAVIKIKARLE